LLAGRGFGMVIGVTNAIFLARWLGPESRGQLAIILISITFATTLIEFGLPQAFIYIVGKGKYSDREITSSAITLSIVTAVFAGIVTYIILTSFTIVDKRIAIFMLVGVVFGVFSSYALHILMGKELFVVYNIITILQLAFYLTGSCWLKINDAISVVHIVEAYSISVVLSSVISCGWLLRSFSVLPGWRHISKSLIREAVSKGFHLFITSIGAVVSQRITFYLLDYFSGLRAVGLYTVASAIPRTAATVPQQFATAIYARSSRERTHKSLHADIVFIMQILFIAGGLILLALIPLADELMLLLYGNEYAGVGTILLLLLVAAGISSFASIFFNALAGIGMQYVGTLMIVIMASVTTILGIILVPPHGAEGAACAQLVGSGAGLLYVCISYTRIFSVNYIDFFRNPMEVWKKNKQNKT
jgi:O-antigen/teichoic acid export membrane protein